MTAAATFSPRGALALVVAGALAFVILLYTLGAGLTGGSGNDGGSHALGKGLIGYAALAGLLERSGFTVERSRVEAALDGAGVLVLTPPHEVDGADMLALVEARRRIGPTVLVLPKWITAPARGDDARTGWTQTTGTARARWIEGIDERFGTRLERIAEAISVDDGERLRLPAPTAVQSLTISEEAAIPLVEGPAGQALVAYLNDDGAYPALDRWSGWSAPDKPDPSLYPVVIVAEPDLLGNRGMGDRARALEALALFRAVQGDAALPVVFDVTLNGLGRSRNLLTLAFTPPFLAATVALLLAALAAGWRAFLRFGPPRLGARPIAFGKAALVANSAGLIRRAGRVHLLGQPYAALVGQRALRALGLPATADPAAIDAAQARRGVADAPFSRHAAALSSARKPHDLVRHAAALHAIERALSR